MHAGGWALRLNDGTELKLSYRWEGPDNKLRLRDKHMSLVGSTKVEIVVYTPGIYADGYIVFAFPFVRSYVRAFVSSFLRS